MADEKAECQTNQRAAGIGEEVAHGFPNGPLDVGAKKEIRKEFSEFPEQPRRAGEGKAEEEAPEQGQLSKPPHAEIEGVKDEERNRGAAKKMHGEIERLAQGSMHHEPMKKQHGHGRPPGGSQKLQHFNFRQRLAGALRTIDWQAGWPDPMRACSFT
jgi:hypothetical protein